MVDKESSSPGHSGRVLWMWVILAFLILAGAWAALILVAAGNQPEVVEIQQP